MEENKIHLINQIDLTKIIYSKVNEMNDKKLVHIYYEKPGQRLLFQTPQLLNIFDIQKSQYFNELILPLYDCNLKVPLLIQFLKDLDSKIIEGAKNNKNEWFKNKSAIRYKSLIKNLYTSNNQSNLSNNSNLANQYNPSKEDEKYSANGLIKLKITNGVKIVDNNTEIPLENLKKNNYVRLIVELYGVWVSGDVFGIYLKPVMIEQIENKVMNFIDEKEDITEVNYLETEANSEDEYIDNNDLQLVAKSKRRIPIKMESSEDSKESGNLKVENEKMYHFGLHDVNDDLFNTLKKDKKIISILSELNSNNTKKDISLSEMSSDLDDDELSKKNPSNINPKSINPKSININEDSEEEGEEEDEDDDDDGDEDDNLSGSDTSSDDIPNIQLNRR
jgi:CRISPR/Cas system-associated endoribonuclease Cas2